MACSGDYNTWRRETKGGIKYKLVEGFPKVSGDEEKTSGSEQYIIRARDLEDFFAEAMPPPMIVLGVPVRPPRRKMPGSDILVTKQVSFEPFTGSLPGDPFNYDEDAPEGTYDELYRVTIQYETSFDSESSEEDPDDPETFLEHSVTVGGEALLIPPQKLKASSADVKDQQGGTGSPVKSPQLPIVKQIPTIEHILKWKYCLAPNWDRIILALGKVNDKTEPLFFNANKECVMFMGVSGSRQYLWNGRTTRIAPWNLDFRFTHREIEEDGKVYGHNHVYIPETGTWKKIFRAGGKPLNLSTDLLRLFQK